MEACKNCGAPVAGNFCVNCGQRTAVQRLTLRRILSEFFGNLFSLDSHFNQTLAKLVTNPGDVVRSYISGATARYYHPGRFAILIITLTTLAILTLTNNFGYGDLVVDQKNAEVNELMMNIMKRYFNIFSFLFIPMSALFSFLFFFRKKWNFAEHLVLNAYLHSFLFLITTPLVLLSSVGINVVQSTGLAMLVSVGYSMYFLKDTFTLGNGEAVIKGLLIYILTYVLFMVIIATFAVVYIMRLQSATGA